MLSIRKTCVAAVAAGSLVVGVGPARALTTAPNPITNLPQTLPLAPATVGLNALGFNATNYPAIWSGAAALGLTPQLTDVRLYTKGVLSGSFVVKNTNTSAQIPVISPSLTFKEIANGMNTSTLSTTNSTGNVDKAALGQTGTTAQPFPGTPPPANSNPGNGYCPAGNWVAGAVINFGIDVQLWSCTTASQASFTINPSGATTATNWSLIGGGNTNPVASSFWSGNSISIPSSISLSFLSILPDSQTASFALTSNSAENYIEYIYSNVNVKTPAPLPVLGAGLAFGYSRRLRRRIKSSATLAA